MHVEDASWSSPALDQDMGLRVYGHDGRPLVAFPSQDGRFWDFEGFGMVEACAGLIEAGRVRIVAVDGIDWQSWTNRVGPPGGPRLAATRTTTATSSRSSSRSSASRRRARRPGRPVRAWAPTTRPTCCSATRTLSTGSSPCRGSTSVRDWVGEHMDDAVYFNSPLRYLPGLDDPWYLERLREAKIAFVVGQGAWEEAMLVDTRAMERDPGGEGDPGHRRLLGPRRRTTTGRGGGGCCPTTSRSWGPDPVRSLAPRSVAASSTVSALSRQRARTSIRCWSRVFKVSLSLIGGD